MLVEVAGRKFKVNWEHKLFSAPVLAEVQLDVPKGKPVVKRLTGRRPKRNGMTLCYIEEVDGSLRVSAKAECSRKDQYNKKIGRAVSLERAVQKLAPELSEYLQEHKEIRTSIHKQLRPGKEADNDRA